MATKKPTPQEQIAELDMKRDAIADKIDPVEAAIRINAIE